MNALADGDWAMQVDMAKTEKQHWFNQVPSMLCFWNGPLHIYTKKKQKYVHHDQDTQKTRAGMQNLEVFRATTCPVHGHSTGNHLRQFHC